MPLITSVHCCSQVAATAAAEAQAASLGGDGGDRELTLSTKPVGGADAAALQFDAYAIDVDERAEAARLFDPGKGNVIFASAFDGWAFTVRRLIPTHSRCISWHLL